MRPVDITEGQRILAALNQYHLKYSGISPKIGPKHLETLTEQIIESQRRNRYIRFLLLRPVSPASLDSRSAAFDPLKVAIARKDEGDLDEAFWMVFFFIHFGKHRIAGWRYAREVYGGGNRPTPWSWSATQSDTDGFRSWLEKSRQQIGDVSRGPHGFGNHRKYESLSGVSPAGTGAVVESYVQWVTDAGSHAERFGLSQEVPTNFDNMFRSMASVHRFGRTARFDYLSLVGKLGLAAVIPAKAYLVGSTGPRRGANLLFYGIARNKARAEDLDSRIDQLQQFLRIGYDELEDALCNWQKSPLEFKPFRG